MITIRTTGIWVILLLVIIVELRAEEQAQDPVNAALRTLVQTHCVHCHGPQEAKANLRLDQLGIDLTDAAVFSRWRQLLSRMRAAEMPPPGEGDLTEVERAAAVKLISGALNKAAPLHRRESRVVLRRLNRVEYENTVRDLFAVDVSVKELLPEGAVSHGFDNVGAALQVSPVLIERYLDAADAVLNAAVAPVHQFESKTERFVLYDSLPKWFLPGVWKQDEGVILFRNSDNSSTDLRQFKAPAPGRYRFRIAASAHNSPTPLPMAALVGNFVVSGNPVRHLGYFDAPPGKPTVIELEERLVAKNDTIKVAPVDLPFVYLRQETLPEYPGPGLHIHWIEVEGPLPEAWPTESYRRVFGSVDPKQGNLKDAEKLLRDLLPRAFRRSVAEGEEQPFVDLVAQSLAAGQTFEVALRTGIKAVLTSPKFLYFHEPTNELNDDALANRLSYFLWSTMPDETLFQLARTGDLHRPEVLRAQVERMLRHPKAHAFTENFTGQWLSLRDINATTPDKTLYPEFEELLQWSSLRETHLFFREMLDHDLSVRNIIDSNFTMLNGRLAKHYHIPDVHGVTFRKVDLKPEYRRGGVLTHASVLKVTANGTNTSPVLRGVWVLDRIMGRAVSPPPPNVPAVEPDIRGATTMREQLAKHRSTKNCAGCHAQIDPPGFALENYDVIGGWRERYRVVAERKDWVKNRVGPLAKYLAAYQYGEGQAVEAGDVLPNGRRFTDVSEFKQVLLEDPEQIARCLTEKLITYATGHPASFHDHLAIEQIIRQTRSTDYGLRSLVHAVVASDTFQRK